MLQLLHDKVDAAHEPVLAPGAPKGPWAPTTHDEGPSNANDEPGLVLISPPARDAVAAERGCARLDLGRAAQEADAFSHRAHRPEDFADEWEWKMEEN